MAPGQRPSAGAAEDMLQRASAAIQNQRPEEAARLAQEVLKANPRQPRALHLFGYAMLMLERPGEAIGPLEDAYKALRDPAIETQVAICLRKLGRIDDALSRLARAVKRKPVFPAAIHELGFTLHSLGRNDEAIEVLNRGIETAPRMIELFLLLGWIFHAGGDLAKAKAAFARAAAIAPQYPDVLYGLGTVLKESGEYTSAAEHFGRVLAINPNDAQSRLNLAQCLLEAGQSDAAYACLRMATRSGPQIYGTAMKMLVKSGRGRFWLRPSAAARFFKGGKN